MYSELEIKPLLNNKLIPPHVIQTATMSPAGAASSGDGPEFGSVIMSPAVADHHADN